MSSTNDDTELTRSGAQPRLLALRMHGFKSFAERTTIEFGHGINAVVGPNGSGKSNLADALRWALGEQGRALRSRKAEDVIWGGSERRAAQGMADVSLVIDNSDGLLPIEFQVLELGRRLYRSGENDYLLNKSRIRLRDLVDLLDAAHLADNAFLFIGQGMVDQALALRADERRPLFDEVAGVRRHERRRRHAEEQLAESEANLARVEDILGELRPQARRLGAQAEQQASREATAEELVSAVLASVHSRWFEAAGRAATAGQARERAKGDVDRLLEELAVIESDAAALGRDLAMRTTTEGERRATLDLAQARAGDARLRDARLGAAAEALERDRDRLQLERADAETELVESQRSLVVPIPPRDLELEATLAAADRELGDAMAELVALRGASQAHGQDQAARRRVAAARQAEADLILRRVSEAESRLTEEADRTASLTVRRDECEAALLAARVDLSTADLTGRTASAAVEARRQEASLAEAGRVAAEGNVATAAATLASERARLAGLESRLVADESRGIARAARRLGGRRLDEDLAIEDELRSAVEIALAESTRAYVVGAAAVTALAMERGSLVVAERADGRLAAADSRERRFIEGLAAAGGGTLDSAVQRDTLGAARRLLARCAWLPDLAACLVIQPLLPPGWIVIPRDGSAVVSEMTVRLGSGESVLERRAEAERMGREVIDLEAKLAERRSVATRTVSEVSAALAAVDAARAEESGRTSDRRSAEEAERLAARQLEAVVREMAWHEAQVGRLTTELERARAATVAADERVRADGTAEPPGQGTPIDGAALAIWEGRAAELRARRDRLAEEAAVGEAARREAGNRRARAEAMTRLAEERAARADRDLAGLGERERTLIRERDALRHEMAVASASEEAAREALAVVLTEHSLDRERLDLAERQAAGGRDRLRSADERLRAADHAELEMRLGLDALRENAIGELAGLGSLGMARLTAMGGLDPASPGPALPSDQDEGSDELLALEAAFASAASRWAMNAPSVVVPGAARLGQLRRRFHELGAVNPFAVAEYAALKTRLAELDGQATDLRTAIARTRDLIAELDALISERFRSTFQSLETAFAAKFEQLFGGGSAKLSLTDPTDIGSSGIEIMARPPGKKAQALAMLSGGERALTAVALLFAMLEVRPVPFCVLDEVDAALDEANIGRFADALRSLAHLTQFIVITHNRGTIEAADTLYGVTSGEDSVSRVISLRLDEAQALAARNRGAFVTAG